jgi:hypothetical protein
MGDYASSYNMYEISQKDDVNPTIYNGITPDDDRSEGSILLQKIDEEYIKVPLETLRLGSNTGFCIYLKVGSNGSYVLYREGTLKFGEEQKRKLANNNIQDIYVNKKEQRVYRRYLEDNLSEIVADDSFPVEKKSEIVYQCANDLVQELFENPRLGENVSLVELMVDS